MILFWSFVIVMIVVALAVILQPLRRGQSADSNLTRQQQNISIAKERLEELKLEFEQGAIEQDSYDKSCAELELALLQDIETGTTQNAEPASAVKKVEALNTFRILVVIVPLFSLGLYFYLGKPAFVSGEQTQSTSAMPAEQGHGGANGKLPSIEAMVENLAKRLQREPGDAKGWYMLGRSYMSLGQYDKAVMALEKTNKLIPSNPDVMLRYADAITMTQGGQIQGKPFELIKQALKLSPENTTGLWLAGMGYEEQGEHATAISYWKRLLPLLQDDKSISEVKILISQAKQKAGISTDDTDASVVAKNKIQPASKLAASIKVDVSLDAALLAKTNKDDTVFIFARAVNGPPMPLAVVRKKVKNLPVHVELNDSMAMMPTLKISDFKQVKIVARVSKSGNAKAQTGDLESDVSIVSPGQKEKIKLAINKIVQ